MEGDLRRLTSDQAAQMSALEICKHYGLAGTAELSQLCGRSVSTLQKWHRSKMDWFLFHAEGAAIRKFEAFDRISLPPDQ